jgi:hypothetical protein
MGKGKGTFDHWGTLVPPGKMIFELSAPDLRVELARRALLAAGRALPGPVQFVNKATLDQPALVGFTRTPVFHAGMKVEGPIDRRVRTTEIPPVIASKQVGYEKLGKIRKGLARR